MISAVLFAAAWVGLCVVCVIAGVYLAIQSGETHDTDDAFRFEADEREIGARP